MANPTHSVMTPTKQRIAIAEACGWKFVRTITNRDGETWDVYQRGEEIGSVFTGTLPDYLSDLNACAEMEKALGPNAFNYVRSLEEVVAKAGGWEVRKQQMDDAVVFATAPQRCEAFLRTLGLWQEPPHP